MNDVLIYESKGTNKKHSNNLKLSAIFLFILLLISFFELRSTITRKALVYGVYYTQIEEGPFVYSLLMCMLAGVAVYYSIALMLKSKDCWVKVYSDYLEAKTFTSLPLLGHTLKTKIIKVQISKIDYIEIERFNIFITVSGKKERIVCEDIEKLFLVISDLTKAYQFIAKKYKTNSDASSSASSQQIVNSVPSDEELMSDDQFQTALSEFRRHWRWMTLANGERKDLHYPIILFDNNKIILKKHGDKLRRKNIDAYRNSSVFEDRETALELFANDLFGEYAEAAKKNVDIEYVAIDYIELEPDGDWYYDFTLTFTWESPIKNKRAQDLFRKELSQTSILKF